MTGETVPAVECPQCGRSIDVRALLDRLPDCWRAANAVIAETPCCGSRQELRLVTGKVLTGRVYAAGRPRFRTARAFDVPIKVKRSQDALVVKLEDDCELCILPQ